MCVFIIQYILGEMGLLEDCREQGTKYQDPEHNDESEMSPGDHVSGGQSPNLLGQA